MNTETLVVCVLGSSLLAIFFALYMIRWVLRKGEGTDAMKAVSLAVREGASAYLRQQYKIVGAYFGIVFLVLLGLSLAGYLVIFVPFAFLTGGMFSALSGFIGMWVATRANVRTTNAAKTSLNDGLRVAFNSGTVMGLMVVGLGLLDIAIWFSVLNWYYGAIEIATRMQHITSTMLTFGMGASSLALFARVGGGIFTKAADVGADLVGKIEKNIPEDDARNPATIADNVGDNVGDVAGMGADLYESYVGSIIATMVLGIAAGFAFQGVVLPLVIAGVGVVSSIIGSFFVRAGKEATQSVLLRALRMGIYSATLLTAILSYIVIYFVLGPQHINLYYSVLAGLGSGVVIGFSTEYYTSNKYKPTRDVAEASETGPATVLIRGMATGMLSTAIPVITVCVAMFISFFVSGGGTSVGAGLYGIGLAAVGMLATLGITLASDAYGPVADNSGGIAQMTRQPSYVRKRTDAYDSLGNTTAATGKGFAIGSAALTALALIAAYREELGYVAQKYGVELVLDLSVMNPKVMIGLFLGGMLPFVFCAFTMKAVGEAAEEMVKEVRRQFKCIKGLMQGKAKPDYRKCVMISTRAAQKQMIMPSMLAIVAPIVVGLVAGVEAVFGLLAGSLVTGFMLAIYMANAGGLWDNAKKYVEAGNFGGKGSDQHKATVVGDTVGDPLKDTSGPSLNILIKLMSMVSIVFASFILLNSIGL